MKKQAYGLNLHGVGWTLVLSVMLAFPQAGVDRGVEAPDVRSERLSVLARGLAGESDENVSAALSVAWHESRLARYVWWSCQWIPKGASGHCDRGKAKTVFQLHKRACPEVWALEDGSDAQVIAGAKCAVKLLKAARRRCGSLEGMFGGYAGSCGWRGSRSNGAKARVATYRRILVQLKAGRR